MHPVSKSTSAIQYVQAVGTSDRSFEMSSLRDLRPAAPLYLVTRGFPSSKSASPSHSAGQIMYSGLALCDKCPVL